MKHTELPWLVMLGLLLMVIGIMEFFKAVQGTPKATLYLAIPLIGVGIYLIYRGKKP
jgi:hypothetical protein